MTNRRTFLKKSAIISAGVITVPTIISSCVKGANDKITIGMIGTGEHGIGRNLNHYLKIDRCRVIAACDVDAPRRNKAKAMTDEKYENKDCKTYDDFRELLENRKIDAIQISTPDHWHVPLSILAMEAGKDVCCEKPSLTIEQGRMLADYVKKSPQVYQTSLEDRSYSQYLRMAELVRNGHIGQLKKIRVGLPGDFKLRYGLDVTEQPVPKGFNYDMWLGPAPYKPYSPARCHWNFRWINDYSGGSLADWGAHLIDTAQWLNGTEKSGPISVEGKGETMKDHPIYDAFNKFDLKYEYENGVEMDVHSKFVEIYAEGTDGWLLVKNWNGELTASSTDLLNHEFGDKELRLYTAQNEFENFLDCIVSRKDTYHPAENMHRTATMAHMGNIAMILGRKLNWDPKKEEFLNDIAANAMRTRKERDQWSLKTLLG